MQNSEQKLLEKLVKAQEKIIELQEENKKLRQPLLIPPTLKFHSLDVIEDLEIHPDEVEFIKK